MGMIAEGIPDDLSSISGGARKIGVSRRTIYNWIEAGKIELYRTAGGSPKVSMGDLIRKSPRRQPKVVEEQADVAAAGT